LFTGCSLFEKRNPLGAGYYLPLDVQLREAPSISEARILYQDACGQAQTIPINTFLHNALIRKTGLVFEKVVTGEKQVSPSSLDGYVDVALGINQTDLVIYQKAKRTYPVTVTLGLDFAYTNTEGTVLFRKKIQSAGSGEVNVPSETGCEVRGLEKVLQDTIATVTDGMALQLGESTKIREQVAARQSGTPRPMVIASPPSPLQTSVAAAVVPLSAAVSSSEATREPLPIPSDQPATLTFRAIMRDQNRNLLLHGGEVMTIEVEVKNEGPGTAQGVEIHVGGTPALTEHVSRVLSIGELRPGDVKRVALDGKIGTVQEPLQAELILTLHASSTLVQAPAPKKFVVAMKPESDAEASRMPVDVDQLPKRAGKLRQPRAVAIAIGVGQFRDGSTPRIKFAARDAEMMGAYLTALGGIPPDRVRTLVDSQALKNDMAEVLEEWLPKQADPTTVV
jgi:hypothetical protein